MVSDYYLDQQQKLAENWFLYLVLLFMISPFLRKEVNMGKNNQFSIHLCHQKKGENILTKGVLVNIALFPLPSLTSTLNRGNPNITIPCTYI